MHPDHQEIHLRNFALNSQGVQWHTAGSEAAIQYGQDSIVVKDLRLVNGDQEITAEGTFGRSGDGLRLTLRNVDVGTFDAVLLREPQLSGRLNASSTISGTKEAPDVQAEFKIEQGGFRQFKYDSFGGTVNYSGAGITVDSRLEQGPTTWLAAKGYVPLALFWNVKKGD